jgi:hypothetical protein
MIYRSKGDRRSNLVAEILEHCIIKKLGIIDFDVLWDAIAVDDILTEEFSDGCGAYVYDRLHLNPFCEVLDSF